MQFSDGFLVSQHCPEHKAWSHIYLRFFTVCIEDTSVVSKSEFRCLVQAESSSTALLNLHQETCISSLVQSCDIWYHAFLPAHSRSRTERFVLSCLFLLFLLAFPPRAWENKMDISMHLLLQDSMPRVAKGGVLSRCECSRLLLCGSHIVCLGASDPPGDHHDIACANHCGWPHDVPQPTCSDVCTHIWPCRRWTCSPQRFLTGTLSDAGVPQPGPGSG